MTADRGADNEDPMWSFGMSSLAFPDLGATDPFSGSDPFGDTPGFGSSGSDSPFTASPFSPFSTGEGGEAPAEGNTQAEANTQANTQADANAQAEAEADASPAEAAPTVDSDEPGSSLDGSEPADGRSRITRMAYGRHIRVLLVEPDSERAAAFTRAAEESVLDVRTEVTDDPEAAFARLERSVGQLLRKPLPDIVVTSIEVPEAHRLLEMLRHDSRFDDLPVLVLAPSASPQDERRSFALGAAAHLVAPNRDYERVALVHALPDFIPRARAVHAHLESHRP